ncbi:hypothetical protein BDN72DRAFT_863681 [Pluteus cervinus]|uniref:Uncharacterized protein n=1 Tax=Pluteus cervinus TaxID=181527 RepID=A0ACD3A623_9AGAR|nr:hypothetical protein BDN72DRAFT_863681 [Pluteus cervinus]
MDSTAQPSSPLSIMSAPSNTSPTNSGGQSGHNDNDATQGGNLGPSVTAHSANPGALIITQNLNSAGIAAQATAAVVNPSAPTIQNPNLSTVNGGGTQRQQVGGVVAQAFLAKGQANAGADPEFSVPEPDLSPNAAIHIVLEGDLARVAMECARETVGNKNARIGG